MADFTIERMPSGSEPTTLEVADFVIEKMPAPADAFDAARDIAYQAPQGFNVGLDSIINAPYNLIRAGANALGANVPEAKNYIADTFNSGVAPVGAAGRMARTAGEVVGASVPFAVTPMALALRPAATVAPSARAAPAIAPQTTLQGVGHDIMQGIRSNPTGAAQIEAASAAGSGAATALAREAEAGPLVETMAGLAGGFAPALVPAARTLLRPDVIPVRKPDAPPPPPGATLTEQPPARQPAAERKQPPAASYEAPAPRKVVTPDGSMEIDVSPQLVELDDLRPSEGALQPRDRTRDEYVQEARERATKLDPSRLQGDRVSDSGAPIVMADGTILSGNGRALSISEVYANPNLAGQRDAYRASLGPDAANMRKPVLVMRSDLSGPDAERFAAASNTPRAARMSATERAAADAKALGDDFKLYQGGDFDAPQNIDFMRSFVSKAVPPAERASISKDGRLTKEGSDRMRGAVLASAFDDADTLSRLLESTDDNVRGLSGAMTDVAPAFASLKTDIGGGHVLPGLDPTKDIQEAVKLVASLRARGTTPQAHFAQFDAFGGTPKGVEAWARAFYSDDMGNQLSRPQIAAMMRAYADEAAKHAPGGLFADNTTAADVLKVARRAVGSVADEVPAAGAGAPPAPPSSPRPPGAAVYDAQGRVAGHIDNDGNFIGGGGSGAPPGDRMSDGRPLPPDDAITAPAGAGGGGEPPAPPSDNRVAMAPQTRPNRAQRARPPSYLSREFRPEAATRDDLLEAGQRTGIPISRAVASENDLERRVAAGVSDAVLVGQPLREAAGKTLDALQAATEKVLRTFGSGERWNAGNAASLAIREWMATGSREVTKRLYTEVAKQFNKKLTSAVPRTKAIADDLAREIADSTSEVNQRALDLIEGALRKPGGMSYDGLIKLRQDIGARFDGSIMPEPGTPVPALKRIYGALSDDIHELVFRFGGERALNRYLKAERVNQLAAQKRKELAELVGDSATAPASRESVVDGILAKAGSKKSGDLTGLLEARKIAGSEAWDEIAAHAISRMGFTDDGGFSAERFFTEYSKMTENGRRVLFGSTGKGDLKQTLDDIATIASKARALNRMRNTSGTFTSASAVNLVATGVTGVLFHPITVALPMAGTYAIARMLAKPATAKQVSRWAQARVKLHEAPSQSAQLQYALVSRNLAHALAEEFDEDEDRIGQTLLSAGAP